jgi:Uncharacterised nucleotidyltransferase
MREAHGTEAQHAWDLMLALCRSGLGWGEPDDAPADEVRRRWALIGGLSEVNGVAALARRGLRGATGAAGPHGPPLAPTQPGVSGATISAHHARLIGDLTSELDEAGIPHAVIKGLALAHTCYPAPDLRPYGDIDLLVDYQDACRAAETLSACRCQPNLPSGWSVDQFRDYDNHLPCVREGASVELHWDLVSWRVLYEGSPTQGAARRMLERRVRVRIGGTDTWTLGREDALLHAALHLFYHLPPRRLLWLWDIALLAFGGPEPPNWEACVEEVSRSPRPSLVGSALSVAVSEAARLTGAAEPPETLARLPRHRLAPALLGWHPGADTARNFPVARTAPGAVSRQTVSRAVLVLLPWLAAPRRAVAARTAVRRLFPGRETLEERYGTYQPAVSHLRHWARLARVAAGRPRT